MDFFFSNVIQGGGGINGYSDGPHSLFDLSGFHDVVESIMHTRKKKTSDNTPSFSASVTPSGKDIGLCGAVDLNKDWGNKAHPLTSLPNRIDSHRQNSKSEKKKSTSGNHQDGKRKKNMENRRKNKYGAFRKLL